MKNWSEEAFSRGDRGAVGVQLSVVSTSESLAVDGWLRGKGVAVFVSPQ